MKRREVTSRYVVKVGTVASLKEMGSGGKMDQGGNMIVPKGGECF